MEDKKETLVNHLYINIKHIVVLVYFQMCTLYKLFQGTLPFNFCLELVNNSSSLE